MPGRVVRAVRPRPSRPARRCSRSAPTPAARSASPGALTGTVAMKPTYGRVSRYGCVAFASSLDQIGPFSKTVEECAQVMNVICGKDPMDATSVERPVEDFTARLRDGVKGLRVGVVRDLLDLEGCDPKVRERVLESVESLAGLGAEVGEVDLPSTQYGLPAYYIIGPAEASSNLARFDGIRYGHRAAGRRGRARPLHAQPRRGLRARGDPAHHDRHLRAVRGLLRRLLRPGAEGPHAHHPRLRAGVRRLRRAADADVAHDRVQDRREGGRPGLDVPVGRLHDPGQPRGHPRGERAVRDGRRAAGRAPDHGHALRRGHDPARRARGRGDVRLRPGAAAGGGGGGLLSRAVSGPR